MSILDEIFMHKRSEVAEKSLRLPLPALKEQLTATSTRPDFIDPLVRKSGAKPALIAEVKHKSPSKGVLRQNFDPLALAQTYRENDAAAISVLTDAKYFGGELDYLRQINRIFAETDHPTPTLRKDFVFSEYQIVEAALTGASAVLLITAMLQAKELAFLIDKSINYGLTPFVETHSRSEIETALSAGASLIGVNNRDLRTFSVDLNTTLQLREFIPPSKIMVSESGIKTHEDVRKLAAAGVDAMLVGETLVRQPDPGDAIRRLRGES